MAIRKLSEQSIRKISKVGGGKSFAVTIPIEYMRKLKWKEKQLVIVSLKGTTLTIKDWKPDGKRKS